LETVNMFIIQLRETEIVGLPSEFENWNKMFLS
jgi:hypothetical protein